MTSQHRLNEAFVGVLTLTELVVGPSSMHTRMQIRSSVHAPGSVTGCDVIAKACSARDPVLRDLA